MSESNEKSFYAVSSQTSISIQAHGMFVKITAPQQYEVRGGIRHNIGEPDVVITGSSDTIDGHAYMYLRIGNSDTEEGNGMVRIGDKYDGIDATKLIEKIADFVLSNAAFRSAAEGE